MPSPSPAPSAVIVGGGHNGLVAAALLARAGVRTTVVERLGHLGGAAVSERPFAGVDVRLSRYAYLVSLFPRDLAADLGIALPLRRRRISSYTPRGESGLLVDAGDEARTAASMERLTGDPGAAAAWRGFYGAVAGLARRLAPTLLEPLRTRAGLRALAGDEATWEMLVERPLGEALEARFADDTVRGIVLTDALIGTLAGARDADLRQNRCFLYHLIGNGTGDWDVPVGGMGAVTDALAGAARAAGADLRTGAEATAIDADGRRAVVRLADGEALEADHVLCGAAPAVLDALLGRLGAAAVEPGAQLKVNLVLERLPRLRDAAVAPQEAFAGTFHVNEGYAQLEAARRQAAAGEIPALPPCETYCHSLSDPSIVGPALRERGVQTLTLFGLHMPAALFAGDHDAQKERALAATLASVDAVLGEPLMECVLRAPDGSPCIEAKTPVELERELRLPGGNIFHRDLAWPFAEDEAQAGRWGTETDVENVWLCGAGARRGGGVSGIPGHNAARAVLERLAGRETA